MALHAALELQLTAERADQPMHTPMDEGNDSPEERGPEAAGSDSGASTVMRKQVELFVRCILLECGSPLGLAWHLNYRHDVW